MQALVAQLQPHFLYNALNTIKWMAVINKQENIRNLTEAPIYILMNAAKSDKENYTLKEEIELIEALCCDSESQIYEF
ncbi:histidine kinase [Blautia sp. RD014234]|nr:histidine kinase [Blautia parvula]